MRKVNGFPEHDVLCRATNPNVRQRSSFVSPHRRSFHFGRFPLNSVILEFETKLRELSWKYSSGVLKTGAQSLGIGVLVKLRRTVRFLLTSNKHVNSIGLTILLLTERCIGPE